MHRNITKFTLLALLWVICTGPSSAQSLEGVLTDDVAYTRQKFSFPPSLGKPRGVLITVRINDSPREFSFLLDTGANATTITKATADALKLPVKKLPPNTPFAQG
ncbi:MAG: retroviral-like aspartic protease family protein, partial [Fibrella sp.]|nr:retroviral-like aspartic protease family protein [Armatimonadota bacterium]